ncbi:MAG: imidazole glycerol phosphate synthase subunit HisH [Candidatus Limnocylindrales bacterium]
MSEPIRVAVVDYGAGNLISIRNALQLLGAEVAVAAAPDQLEGAEVILVPGVGASEAAMGRLRRQGLVEPILERVRGGTWFVGICLGMQLLFDTSDEDGARMLGLLQGEVKVIEDAPSLPHIGWNTLEVRREHPVLEGLTDGTPAYFVHSYVPVPADPAITVAETEHGSRFASLVAADRIVGFQFHPERSGADGIRMLRNTLGLIEADRPARAKVTA